MAKVIQSEKGFKLIETSRLEIVELGGLGICDSCGNTAETGVYIAVLNSWYCKECFEKWHKRAKHYAQDSRIEERNFNVYKSLLSPKI